MKNEELAYFAGYFDGEGSIGIYKHKSKSCKRGYTFELLCQISSTEHEVIWLFREKFGGSFRSFKHKETKKKRIWMCQICSRQALKFLQRIYPFLKLKKAIAQLAIEFQSKKKWGQNLTDEEYQYQEMMREKISFLNKKRPKDLREIWGEKLIQEMPK